MECTLDETAVIHILSHSILQNSGQKIPQFKAFLKPISDIKYPPRLCWAVFVYTLQVKLLAAFQILLVVNFSRVARELKSFRFSPSICIFSCQFNIFSCHFNTFCSSRLIM